MRKKNLWSKTGEVPIEVYRSTQASGNRYSLGGSSTVYNLRPCGFGINAFGTRADAEAFLVGRGYAKQV
jgi:hypothetical protein